MTERRPNIILIMTDQQRYDTIGALGYPYMETPEMDRLVNEGTAFTRCYINAASCVPARASLFNGYHPHTTGILRNGDSWRHTWVERLAEAGYFCANLGKMHFQPFDAQGGFHVRHTLENKERRNKEVGLYYLDEWDRALAAHGIASRPELPRLARLRGAPGRLRMAAGAGAPFRQLHRRFLQVVDRALREDRAPVPADRLSGAASTLRSDRRDRRPLPREGPAAGRDHGSRISTPSRRPSRRCASATWSASPIRSRIASAPRARRATASAPTISPTSP